MLSFWFHGWATDSRIFNPLVTAMNIPCGVIASNLETILGGVDPCSWGECLSTRVRESLEPGEKVVLAGWSMGAMLALEVASALGDHCAGLVIVSGCARFVRDRENVKGQAERILHLMQRRLSESSRAVLEDFFAGMFAPGEMQTAEAFRQSWFPLYRDQNPAWLASGLEYLCRTDCRVFLSGIQSPTLVIHGGNDSIIAPALGKTLARNLTRGELLTVEGAGHALLLSKLLIVASNARAFIEKL